MDPRPRLLHPAPPDLLTATERAELVARAIVVVVLRTFVLATIAVPIVIYGLMPHLHKLRIRILTHAA